MNKIVSQFLFIVCLLLNYKLAIAFDCSDELIKSQSINHDFFNDFVSVIQVDKKRADHLMELAKKISTDEESENFDPDRQLLILLCASNSGNPQAAYRAAQLTTSGQAIRLPNKSIESLLIYAAKNGVNDANVFLSSFYCDYEEKVEGKNNALLLLEPCSNNLRF